ncbi:hypothetical protein FRC03_004771 [Tulasnella sp. 419]|nr:hypothetical protein FRC03_004771 [Tulasnella sp. 419]
MNGRNRLIKPRRHFVEPLPDIPPLPAHRFRFYVPNPGVHRQPFQGDFVPLPQEAQKVIQDFKASLGPISDTWFTKDRTTEVIDWNGTLIFALQNAARTVCSRFQKFGYVGVLGWCDEFSDLVKSIEDIAYRGQLLLSTRELVLVTCEDILQLDEVKTVNIIALQLSSQIHRLYQVLGNEPQE